MKEQRKFVLEAPIARALWRLAWPIALSNELSILSLGVLLFWLGRLAGETGLAVEAVFRPLGLLVAWLINATSVGCATLVARSVGAQDGRGLSIAAGGATLTVAMWAVFAAVVAPLSPWLAELLASELPDSRPMLHFMLGWMLVALPALSVVEVLLDVANSTGATRFSLARVLLDLAAMAALVPIFLLYSGLGLGGAPVAEGLAGLGLLAVLWAALVRHRARLGLGDLEPGAWRIRWPLWKDILAIGLPVQVGRVSMFAVQLVLAQRVLRDGSPAVAGYGVALALLLFGAQATLSLAQAGAVLVGQSLGAKKFDRAKLGVRTVVIGGWIVMGVFFVATLFDRQIIGLFTSDAAVAASAEHALSIVRWAGFAIATFQILLASFAAHRATIRAGLLLIAGDCVGLAVGLSWPGSNLDAGCYGFLAAALVKASLLLGFVATGALEKARARRAQAG